MNIQGSNFLFLSPKLPIMCQLKCRTFLTNWQHHLHSFLHISIRDSTARNLNKSVMSGQQLLAKTNKTSKQTDNVYLVLGFSSLTTGDVCSFQSSMTSTDKQQWIQNALWTTICSTLCHSKSLNSTTHFLLVHSPITKKWAESWLSGIFQKKSPFPWDKWQLKFHQHCSGHLAPKINIADPNYRHRHKYHTCDCTNNCTSWKIEWYEVPIQKKNV